MRIAHGFLFCLVMAFATASVCYAQNNPYQIDDECYKYMTEADRLIGKPGFDEQNELCSERLCLRKTRKLRFCTTLKNCVIIHAGRKRTSNRFWNHRPDSRR